MKKLYGIVAAAVLGVAAQAGSLAPGTMHNPMIWADAPDPDVIRVDSTYYMVTTTMHLMPGAPVMKSADLVHWQTIGYVFDRLTDNPRYDLEGGNVYGRGQWATSLRWRDGRFYVLFSPNDEPWRCYIYTATDAAGPWTLLCRDRHFHDASLLLDDDGRAYVVYNGGTIHLTQLQDDLSGVKPGGLDCDIIFPDSTETGLHEGSRVIKHGGKYYAMVISWPSGKPRRQLCYRADTLTGPWEKCVVLESTFGGFPYVGQGTIVDTPEGDWWGVIFQDRGGVGRVLTLNPCTWRDGWPMLGDESGRVPAEIVKPLATDTSGCGVVESDEFSRGRKSLLWQWNHNPVDSGWSLTERKGHLRLRTTRLADNIYMAPNTISQRMEGPHCRGEIKLDISGMKPGDRAGLAAFNGDSGLLQVERGTDGTSRLSAISSTVKMASPAKSVTGTDDRVLGSVGLGRAKSVCLRISGDFTPGADTARFYYSTDSGRHWKELGEPFKMKFDFARMFMGTRFAIYNYATVQTGGCIDVDYFRYEKF